MALTSLTVDVYCTRSDGSHAYRVSVDGDLLTERTWSWPCHEVFIREHIEVDLGPGAHTVEVRECTPEGVFYTKDTTVNGNPIPGATFFL